MADLGDLPARAARGDRGAFAEIYRRLARPVFLDLVARLRVREDAEDALQAAFLAAWHHLPRLREPGRFVPWLFRIARNKARDLRRRPRAHRLEGRDDLVAPGPAGAADDDVREAVSSLRPDTRALVLLRAVEGWTAEEVARALGLSPSTVRRRYARAMEHLKRKLERSVT